MHFHLHNELGQCYGDFAEFSDAARAAAEHTYPWCVSDNEPIDDILVVIDAPFCIEVCREG